MDSVRWELGTVQTDPEGRYLFIQAWIDCPPYVILSLYLPPPASISILHAAAKFAADYPSSRILCMGDFNLLHDTVLDKFTPLSNTAPSQIRSQLSLFLAEMGWLDLWQFFHPNTLEYTCFTPGRNSLSHIDYICGNSLLFSALTSISHKHCVASDHSPVLAEFLIDSASNTLYRGIKKIRAFWLSH